MLGRRPDGKARTWTSATPFILPRFLKPRGTSAWDAQVRAECHSRGLPEPAEVRDLGRDAMMDRKFLRFVRTRGKDHPQPPSTVPWCLELSFDEPVAGPICLGYGSHFGLGLFQAKPER